MSAGNHNGAAAGFQIDALLKLKEVKSTRARSRTLLHFVAREVSRQHPAGACLGAALPSAQAASRLDWQQARAEVVELAAGVRRVEGLIAVAQEGAGAGGADPGACLAHMTFFRAEALDRLGAAQAAVEEADSAFRRVDRLSLHESACVELAISLLLVQSIQMPQDVSLPLRSSCAAGSWAASSMGSAAPWQIRLPSLACCMPLVLSWMAPMRRTGLLTPTSLRSAKCAGVSARLLSHSCRPLILARAHSSTEAFAPCWLLQERKGRQHQRPGEALSGLTSAGSPATSVVSVESLRRRNASTQEENSSPQEPSMAPAEKGSGTPLQRRQHSPSPCLSKAAIADIGGSRRVLEAGSGITGDSQAGVGESQPQGEGNRLSTPVASLLAESARLIKSVEGGFGSDAAGSGGSGERDAAATPEARGGQGAEADAAYSTPRGAAPLHWQGQHQEAAAAGLQLQQARYGGAASSEQEVPAAVPAPGETGSLSARASQPLGLSQVGGMGRVG